MELLENFRASSVQLVFVVDEYGEVQGMITLRDVLEAITGEFNPGRAEDQWAVQRDDGSWLLDGLIADPGAEGPARAARRCPRKTAAATTRSPACSCCCSGACRETGDTIDWDGWRFEVVDMDGKRIDKVLASPLKSDTPHAAR